MHRHHGANKYQRAPGIGSNACRPWTEQTLPPSCTEACRAVAASFPNSLYLRESRDWDPHRRISESYLPKRVYRQMNVWDDPPEGGRRMIFAGGLPKRVYRQMNVRDDLLEGGRRRASWRGLPKLVYRQTSEQDGLPEGGLRGGQSFFAGGRRRASLRGLPKRVYHQMNVWDDLPGADHRRVDLRGDRGLTALPRRVG